jgi:hypothetical protein
MYPKMSQAIVLNTIDGLRQVEYITAISKIVEPSNIIAASRISNNRFCIFLSSDSIANTLVKNHSHIVIDNNTIMIRKLINPSKRIILSNAYPSIPDGIIINALLGEGIRLTSNISPLKAGFITEQFAHITSFRRQIYINPEDTNKVPSSIAINFEDTIFRIFLTDDTVTSFNCKKTGHKSSSCKNQIQNKTNSYQTYESQTVSELASSSDITPKAILTPDSDTPQSITAQQPMFSNTYNDDPPVAPSDNHITDDSPLLNENIGDPTSLNEITEDPSPEYDNIDITLINNQNKRPASCTSPKSIPSVSMETDSHKEDMISKKKTNNDNKHKKIRTQSDSDQFTETPEHNNDKLDEQLLPTIDAFTEDAPIDYYQFKYIIESSTNKNINLNSLCEDSGISVATLHEFLETIRPKLTDRNIKTKLTKLSNLLFRIMPLYNTA